MSIRLHVEISPVEAGLKALGDQAPKAIARALDRTVLNVRTVMVRKVAGEMRLAQKHVRDRTHTFKTNRDRTAYITASNTQTPVILFAAKGPEPSLGKGSGVTARTREGRYPHGFIAKMRSGHRGVFQRVGKPRLKIRELREASVWSVWIHHGDDGQKRGEEMLPKNLAHEVQFLLNTQVQAAFNRATGVRRSA